MPAPAPTRRRGRGGFALGDSLIARTSSPTRRHPSSADHHHQQHSSPNNHLNTVDLRVTGWRDSRVNTEQDGGIATLSRWLERKAQTALEKDAAAAAAEGVNKRRHTARIRKVCLIRPWLCDGMVCPSRGRRQENPVALKTI